MPRPGVGILAQYTLRGDMVVTYRFVWGSVGWVEARGILLQRSYCHDSEPARPLADDFEVVSRPIAGISCRPFRGETGLLRLGRSTWLCADEPRHLDLLGRLGEPSASRLRAESCCGCEPTSYFSVQFLRLELVSVLVDKSQLG